MEEISEKTLNNSTRAGYTFSKPVSIPDAISQSQTLQSFGVDRVMPRQVTSGSYRGEQAVGSNNLKIDSAGSRIIVEDDANIRVVLGKIVRL